MRAGDPFSVVGSNAVGHSGGVVRQAASVFAKGVAAASGLATSFTRRIESTPRILLVTFVVAIALLKNGVNVTYIWDPALTSPAFPRPVGPNDGTSFGLPGLMWLLRIESHGPMLIVAFALTLGVIVAFVAFAVYRFGRVTGVAVSGAVMWGPIGLVLLSQVGRHDLLTISGGLLLALGAPRIGPTVIGALLMVSGNPEQSVLATVAFLFLAASMKDRGRVRSGLMALAITVVGYVATTAVVRQYGLETRTSLFREMFTESLVNFSRNAPLALYATFGLAGLTLLMIMLGVCNKRRWLAVAGVALPFMVGVVTADQTRVGVCVATPIVVTSLVLAGRAFGSQAAGDVGQVRLAVAALIALVLPPVEVVYPGRVYSPYEYLVSWVQRRL